MGGAVIGGLWAVVKGGHAMRKDFVQCTKLRKDFAEISRKKRDIELNKGNYKEQVSHLKVSRHVPE